MFFLWYLLIGLLSGWIANMIVRGGGAGLVANLIVGLIGGLRDTSRQGPLSFLCRCRRRAEASRRMASNGKLLFLERTAGAYHLCAFALRR